MRLRYYVPVGREIPVQLHNTRGPRPSWRSAFDVLTNRSVVTTRRDILLLLPNSKFPTFTKTAMRFTSHFDGSLAPKVVQIIVSYNNLRAFFAIFRVFGGSFEISDANFGLWACCSPTAEGCASLRRVAVRRGGAAANCAVRRTAIIHMRQPVPRQELFRIKGGSGDEALKIGDFLILKNAKHPI